MGGAPPGGESYPDSSLVGFRHVELGWRQSLRYIPALLLTAEGHKGQQHPHNICLHHFSDTKNFVCPRILIRRDWGVESDGLGWDRGTDSAQHPQLSPRSAGKWAARPWPAPTPPPVTAVYSLLSRFTVVTVTT